MFYEVASTAMDCYLVQEGFWTFRTLEKSQLSPDKLDARLIPHTWCSGGALLPKEAHPRPSAIGHCCPATDSLAQP